MIIIFYADNFFNKIKHIIKGISLGIDNMNYFISQKKNQNKKEIKIYKYDIKKKKKFLNEKFKIKNYNLNPIQKAI